MISEKESRVLYYIKAVAVISIVCAHISVVPENFSQTSRFVCTILSELGAIGVGVFFCAAGFIFRRKTPKEFSYSEFWKKKFQGIIIPWIISALLVYLYVAIRKGGSITECFLSIIGYGSSYWYLTVLMICYVLFGFIRKSKRENIGLGIVCAVACISVLLRHKGVIKQDSLGVYLNVFNWAIFFAIGYLYAKLDQQKIEKLFENKLIVKVIAVLSMLVLIVPYSMGMEQFSYFRLWYIPAEIMICYSTVAIAKSMANKEYKVMMYLGRLSFTIYLYNELLWAGAVVAIGNMYDSWVLVLLRPLIVIIGVIVEMNLGKKIFSKFDREILFEKIVGMR